MCSGVKKIFDAVGSIINKAWRAVKKYLVYIIIIVAIFYPVLWTYVAQMLPTSVAALFPSATGAGIWAVTSLEAFAFRGLVGLGIGFLVDSESARKVADHVADAAKGTAEAVTGIVAGAVGGATAGFLGSGLGTALLVGAGIYLLATREKKKKVDPATLPPAKPELYGPPLIIEEELDAGLPPAR